MFIAQFGQKFNNNINHFHLIRYLKFVEFYKNNIRAKYKTEAHHILPKEYFPEFENLTENKWNCVNLPLRAHFIAHWMLARAIGGKMWRSFQLMGRIKKHKSRHYSKFRLVAAEYNNEPEKVDKISKSVTKLWEDPEYRKRQSDSHKGYKPTEQQNRLISESLSGRKKPEGFGMGRIMSEDVKSKSSKSHILVRYNKKRPRTVYTADGVPVVTIFFDYYKELKKMGLPTSLTDTYKNNSTLYENYRQNTLLINKGLYDYKGYYMRDSR